jgi:plasmid stabilization system protein ParE
MLPLRWSQRALADLARLHTFLAPKNPSAANRAIVTIRAAVEVLREFPELGRIVEERAEVGHRELLVPFSTGGYVATYTIVDDAVEIIDVRHQREAGL